MLSHQFNATAELDRIRHHRTLCKRKAYQHSRLQKLRAELVAMRKAGGSFREIALWLTKVKRIKVTHTTVMRYLVKLPELQPANEDNTHAELS